MKTKQKSLIKSNSYFKTTITQLFYLCNCGYMRGKQQEFNETILNLKMFDYVGFNVGFFNTIFKELTNTRPLPKDLNNLRKLLRNCHLLVKTSDYYYFTDVVGFDYGGDWKPLIDKTLNLQKVAKKTFKPFWCDNLLHGLNCDDTGHLTDSKQQVELIKNLNCQVLTETVNNNMFDCEIMAIKNTCDLLVKN